MDISNLEYSDREIEIVNPGTREELGITLTIMSVNDPRLNTYKNLARNKNLKFQRMNKTQTAEETEEDVLDLLAKTVLGWNWGDNEFKGEKLEFSTANIKKVFRALPWFKDQVDTAVMDESRFFTD